MSLRDEIAVRLRAIRMTENDKLTDEWKNNPEKMPGRAMLSLWHQTDLAQADEVIRLMEWPRRGCDAPDWADRWDDKPMRPLTLPPDDWKP